MVSLANFIMQGRMQAMLVAASLALLSLILPPISIVSSATVALVTLRRGSYEGLLVLLSASVAAAVLGIMLLGSFQFAFVYVLVLWLPVWLISVVLREGRHLSLALEIAAVLGILMVAGFYLFMQNPVAYWHEVLSVMLEPIIQAQAEAAGVPIEKFKQTIESLAQYMTGLLATGAVVGLLLGLLLARWWQAKLYNPGGFATEYLSLRMSVRFTTATIAVLLIAFAFSGVIAEIAGNISIILLILYSFVGTAIAHALLSRVKAKRIVLPLFYVTLFIVPHLMIPVVIIGISDTWLNLRKNITKPSSS